MEEEKPNPTRPIVIDGVQLDPVTIKGFTFKHDGWYGDEGNPNPKYVMNGSPVTPDWVDERGFSYAELPEFSETPLPPGGYLFTNNKDEESLYGYALSHISRGLPLTKDEFINAVKQLNETKKPVIINNIKFWFDPVYGDGYVKITVN